MELEKERPTESEPCESDKMINELLNASTISSITSITSSDRSDCDSLEKNIETMVNNSKVYYQSLSDDAFKTSIEEIDNINRTINIDKTGNDMDFEPKIDKLENSSVLEDHLVDSGVFADQVNCDIQRNFDDLGNSPTRNVRTLRKLPKSKTFDSTMSAYGKTYDNSYDRRSSNSRTHVFMTSQECVVVPGCRLPRETIASRLRFEKQHLSHEKECGYDDYLTPLQRKEILIRDLKRRVRELSSIIVDKDKEIALYKQDVDEETSKLVQGKDVEIQRLRDELNKVKQSYEDITSFCEESVSTASRMEQKAEDLQTAMTDREHQHQRLYLEMYRKGQESARFEREEELERLANSGGCQVTISELVKKLAWTELELAKWQTIRRQESYHGALRPDTEAETTLKFLKDSFFHYLTDSRDSGDHLRAMITIMNFTEPQMTKIKGSKLIQKMEKKRRSKSNNK